MVGTQYAALECDKCYQGFSEEGSDRCSPCDEDYYLNPNTVSLRGFYFYREVVMNALVVLIVKLEVSAQTLTKFVQSCTTALSMRYLKFTVSGCKPQERQIFTGTSN